LVEYAVLLAQNSAHLMGGFGTDLRSWAGSLNWSVLGYVAAGLVLLRVAAAAFWPSRRY
jgi:hypothetical protein